MRITIAAAHPRTIHAFLAVAGCTEAGKQGCFIVTSRAPQTQPFATTLSTTLRGLVCIDLSTMLTTTKTATKLTIAIYQILQRIADPHTIRAPLAVARYTKAGEQSCFIVTGRAPHSQPIVTTMSTTLSGLVCIDLATPLTATHVATTHSTKTRTQGYLTVTGRAPQGQSITTTFSTALRGLVGIDLATLLTTTHPATRLAIATNQILQRTAKAAIVFPSFVLQFEQTWELLPETQLAVQRVIRATIT